MDTKNDSISIYLNAPGGESSVTIYKTIGQHKVQQNIIYSKKENVLIDTFNNKEIYLEAGLTKKDRDNLKSAAKDF